MLINILCCKRMQHARHHGVLQGNTWSTILFSAAIAELLSASFISFLLALCWQHLLFGLQHVRRNNLGTAPGGFGYCDQLYKIFRDRHVAVKFASVPLQTYIH